MESRHERHSPSTSKFFYDYDQNEEGISSPKEFFRSRINAVRKKIRQHAVQTGDWPPPHVIFGSQNSTGSLKEKAPPPNVSHSDIKSSKSFQETLPMSSSKLHPNVDKESRRCIDKSDNSSRKTIFKRSQKGSKKSSDSLKSMIAKMRDGPEINASKLPVFIESDDGGLICPGMDMNGIIEGFVEFEKYFKRGGLLPFANVMPTPIKNQNAEVLKQNDNNNKLTNNISTGGFSVTANCKLKDAPTGDTDVDSKDGSDAGKEKSTLDAYSLTSQASKKIMTPVHKKQVKFEKETELIPLNKKGLKNLKEAPLIPPCALSPSVLKKSSSLDSKPKDQSHSSRSETEKKKTLSLEHTNSDRVRSSSKSDFLMFSNKQFQEAAVVDEDLACDSSEVSNEGMSLVDNDEVSTDSLPGVCAHDDDFNFDADELGLAIQQCLDNIKLRNSPVTNEETSDKHFGENSHRRSAEHSRNLWRKLFRLTKKT